MADPGQLITSLSILQINWNHGKSYLSNFAPLIAQCILEMRSEVISAIDVKKKMIQDFGIDIPLNTINSLLHRLKKDRYLSVKDKIYKPNYELIEGMGFDAGHQEVIRRHNAVIKNLIEFAATEFNIKIDVPEAEKLLLNVLQENDIDLLNCSLFGGNLPEIKPNVDAKKTLLIYMFLKNKYESDPEIWSYLETLIKGHMLSIALLLPDLGRVDKRFRNTSIYLDTSLVLRLLGHEGDTARESVRELASLLFELGAQVRCFKHTRNEVRNVLFACMNDLQNPDSVMYPTPVFQHFVETGYKPSDIELEISALDKRITTNGVRLTEEPERDEQHQIDEKQLEEEIRKNVSYRTDGEKARIYDVDSLASIYMLRKGHCTNYIEDCKAIFITQSSNLYRVGCEYFVNSNYVTRDTISVILTDYALTNILWLKKPIAAPGLPVKQMIAQCYAAMSTDDKTWREYLNRINRLKKRKEITEDDYYLLRYSQEARIELLDLYISGEAITEGTPQDILKRAKEAIKSESAKKAEEEIRKLAEKEKELADVKEKASTAISASRDTLKAIDLKRKNIAQTIAHQLRIALLWIILVMLIAGIVASYVGIDSITSLLLIIPLAATLIFTIYNFYTGETVKTCLDKIEAAIYKSIEALLKKLTYP